MVMQYPYLLHCPGYSIILIGNRKWNNIAIDVYI